MYSDEPYIEIWFTLPGQESWRLYCKSNDILDKWNDKLGKAIADIDEKALLLIGHYPTSHTGEKPRKATIGVCLEFVKFWQCIYKEESE